MTPALDNPVEPAAMAVPWNDNPLVRWLLTDGWPLSDAPSLLKGLCLRMESEGIPVLRALMVIRTLHPQVIGQSFTYKRGSNDIVLNNAPFSVLSTPQYLANPLAVLFEEGAGAIRRRLDLPDSRLDFPILEELKADGATDYVALPMLFSDGRINALTLTCDRPGGFRSEELHWIAETVPILGRSVEAFAMRFTARTLLETYLGRITGERVLQGLVRRGDGEDIHAVIWFSDLRGSTALADSMSREAFLALLNDYFECVAEAVIDEGGEVLRFIGDSVLAIFPIDDCPTGIDPAQCEHHKSACSSAMRAVDNALARLAETNTRREAAGLPALHCGIGLHLGDVTYGNIGVPSRLEFTVIGAAANEAARIEDLCKVLNRPVLASAEFARIVPEHWESVGAHDLRGVRRPREIFGLAASPAAEINC